MLIKNSALLLNMAEGFALRSVFIILFCLVTNNALAAIGDTLFSDDFESGFGNWSTNNAARSGINTLTTTSTDNHLFTRHGAVVTASVAIDLSAVQAAGNAVQLNIEITHGSDDFFGVGLANTNSEYPETGEDLEVGYIDSASNFVVLETFNGGGTAGQVMARSYLLTGAAVLHNAFQIQVRQNTGNGVDWDYWHIDDAVITEVAAPTPPPPFGLGGCDDFEGGFGNWTTTNSVRSGIDTLTTTSTDNYLYTRNSGVTTTSIAMDLSSLQATAGSGVLEIEITRGADTFFGQTAANTNSENPDAGEDLQVGYIDSGGTFVVLETFPGNGAAGEVISRSYALTGAGALHSAFQVQVRQLGGSGVDFDYWHVDDVCIRDSRFAYYAMDETTWPGVGTLLDSTGNGNNASPLGGVIPANPISTPAIVGDPGTCGYADIPDNTNNTIDAIATGYTPGDQGAISFWFNNKSNWNTDGDRLLFDASNDLGNESADKHFFLVRRNNNSGSLRFVVEDSADNLFLATATNLTIAAGTWVHIAVTWDMPGDLVEIYVNGVLRATDSAGSNGSMGNLNDLYIGDNRTTGVVNNSWSNDSANGYIDEFRIYETAISAAQVNADMASSHACSINTADHFAINHSGTAVNCEAAPITIEAHLADHTIDTSYAGVLNLSTSTGRGDWSVISGAGVLNNGAANDGLATYDLQAIDNGVVVLGLKDSVAETVNIDVSDGVTTELTGAAIAAEDLDLVFSQTGFRFIDAANVAIIGTQISGKGSIVAPGAQSLYLQAIRTSDDGVSCTGVFADGVTANIDLGSICSNPGSCLAGQRVSITNNAITTAVANPQNQDGGLNYTSVPLTFTTNSRAPIVLNYSDAGVIQLTARYDIPLGSGVASGNLMTGNSNTFVVRPFGFDMDFNGDRAANGLAGASYAADATGSKFQLAGANFPLDLTAVAWNSADDLDSDGVPDACADLTDNTITANFGNEVAAVVPLNVGISNTLLAPVAGDPGTLTTSANGASFTSGTGSKTISWNEVGIINLNSTLSSYLGSGQDVSGNVCNVGRFYPNNFVIANQVVTDRSDIVACADPFTYMGENFTIAYDLQATSINPPGNITQNYVGAFAKLDVTALADMNYGATDSGTDLSARLNVSSAGVFAGGIAPITATLSLMRNALPDGVYSNFQVGIVPADSDGVTLLPAALDLSLVGGPNSHSLLGQTDIRYGRLNLQNNFGSELLSLTMPMSTEYYLNATAEFITNADDSCTTRTPADILLYNDQEAKAGRAVGNPVINIGGGNTTTLTGISPFVGGQATMTFAAPGVEGYVDIEVQTPSWLLSDLDGIDQGTQGPGIHCNPALAVSDPAYIAGCIADGNIVDEIPSSRGNFGIFKGSENIIYIRETY